MTKYKWLAVAMVVALAGCGTAPPPASPQAVLQGAQAAREASARGEPPTMPAPSAEALQALAAAEAPPVLPLQSAVGGATTIDAGSLFESTRIQGGTVDQMLDSINAIMGQLPPQQAREFSTSVRVVTIGSQPPQAFLSGVGGRPQMPSDEELFQVVMPQLVGKTPAEVQQAALRLQAKFRAQLNQQAAPSGGG